MTDVTKLVQEFEQATEVFQATMKVEMKRLFKEFFEQNPDVAALVWVQYTPYYCDGEPCYFGRFEMFTANAEQLKELREGNIGLWDLEYDANGDAKEVSANAEKSIGELETIPSEIYEDAFGDHCRVIATKDGFDIEEYEHD